jgi:glycogen debranching enzyme
MPEQEIKVQDQYYIVAPAAPADDRTRVLKHNETFAVFDRFGDIQAAGTGEHGIFHDGTRYLSRSVLQFDGTRPVLLSSAIKENNAVLTVDLTNADRTENGKVLVPRGTLHLYRAKFLWNATCYEALRIRNYGLAPVDFACTFFFDADFADIFEVRGLQRKRRGMRLEDRIEDGSIVLSYEGLDGVLRRTRIKASPAAEQITSGSMRFAGQLEAQQEMELCIAVSCHLGPAVAPVLGYDAALLESDRAIEQLRGSSCHIYTANSQFNDWVNRSASDLQMMITSTPELFYPYAGVPWFSTAFGRDGIITALQYLWVDPKVARGVLAFLASTQASKELPEQDAEPGKILHERRGGEMAALGEHPFRGYYGSVDATPLFVLLAAEYYQRTGDLDFIHSIWVNIDRALDWMETYGDPDGDGYIEYSRRSKTGLVQQGWKDSQDSIFHADGRLAEPPIALCEVQAYAFAARRGAAKLALALGHQRRADELARHAGLLEQQFERDFWSDELGSYVLALDGRKEPCMVRASNAGHCLFAGIASPAHAEKVANLLLESDSYSGFGIRTVAAGEARYNPMSYHNGSVWPHDNSLIAWGFMRYGLQECAAKVLSGLFDAALFFDQHRLPELFCGFGRRAGEGPTRYPVACSPQAWASGAAFLTIQACLGLTIDGREKQVRFEHAYLPEFLPELELRRVSIGEASVDLHLERHQFSVGITVLKRKGRIDVLSFT